LAIAKAVAELERMGADPALHEIYEAEEKAKMVELAELQYAEERAEKRGVERGLEQGIEQGLQRGQQRTLLRLIARQIGDVPPTIASRISALEPSQLDELSDALFDLKSRAELEIWLARF
jgi:hypothetical protein